ncbi:MAG: hypothetical protein SFT93_01825 [Rickettsiaceae bacterium]|nr:hypothetical protein [Rickettsiaceae bacterium]
MAKNNDSGNTSTNNGANNEFKESLYAQVVIETEDYNLSKKDFLEKLLAKVYGADPSRHIETIQDYFQARYLYNQFPTKQTHAAALSAWERYNSQPLKVSSASLQATEDPFLKQFYKRDKVREQINAINTCHQAVADFINERFNQQYFLGLIRKELEEYNKQQTTHAGEELNNTTQGSTEKLFTDEEIGNIITNLGAPEEQLLEGQGISGQESSGASISEVSLFEKYQKLYDPRMSSTDDTPIKTDIRGMFGGILVTFFVSLVLIGLAPSPLYFAIVAGTLCSTGYLGYRFDSPEIAKSKKIYYSAQTAAEKAMRPIRVQPPKQEIGNSQLLNNSKRIETSQSLQNTSANTGNSWTEKEKENQKNSFRGKG